MQNDLMKKTTVLCSLFVAAAMGVMLWFCTNKIVVVADVAQDEVVQAAESSGAKGAAGSAAQDGEQPSAEDGNRIDIERDSENTNYFCVPIPPSVRVENVTIENHYMDRQLWVSIEPEKMQDEEAFYEQNGVYGNCEKVVDGHFEVERKRICLQFQLTDVYEYRSILEDNTIFS